MWGKRLHRAVENVCTCLFVKNKRYKGLYE